MVTHKQPYEGMSLAAILFKVVNENMVRYFIFVIMVFKILIPQRPEVPSTCPDPVSGLMMKCWDRDPKKRPTFKTVAQLLEERKPMVYVDKSIAQFM